jgi:DNA-binding IclR family transcriptional regulator
MPDCQHPATRKSEGMTDSKRRQTDRYVVPALQRGLQMLEMYSRHKKTLTIPEMTRELGLSRATAFRLAHTLEANDYLARVPNSNGFQLGRRVLTLGFQYLYSLDVVEMARPELEGLRDRTRAAANLGIRDGVQTLYILRAPSQDPMRSTMPMPVGTRYPAHAVSCGRALLFDLSDPELDQLYHGFTFAGFGSHAPSSLEELKCTLIAERALGYVVCHSVYGETIRNVAAPIRDGSGRVIAAINVADAPLSEADAHGWARDEVVGAARRISEHLGHRSERAKHS